MITILDRPVQILLVEDNPGDVELTLRALRAGKVSNHVTSVKDGVEAMSFLRREGAYESELRPDLILLDLNLPRKGGRETLAEIKGTPEFSDIPVVILTTSEAEKDVLESYSLNANGYIKKPVGLKEFIAIMNSIENFWFTVVILPPNEPGPGS